MIMERYLNEIFKKLLVAEYIILFVSDIILK